MRLCVVEAEDIRAWVLHLYDEMDRGGKAHAVIDDGYSYQTIRTRSPLLPSIFIHPLLPAGQVYQARRRLPVPSRPLAVRNRALARPLQVARGAVLLQHHWRGASARNPCRVHPTLPPSSHKTRTRIPIQPFDEFRNPKGPGASYYCHPAGHHIRYECFLLKALALSLGSSPNLLISRFCCRPSHPQEQSSDCVRPLCCHSLLTLTH